MTDRPLLRRWGRESEAYGRFRAAARDLLATDDRFRAAREEWVEFFVTSHGDVFDDFDSENSTGGRGTGDPADELFLDVLYYDFVVDRLVGAAEREFGFTLRNREPRENTDALSFDFRELHRRVADAGGVSEALAVPDATTAPEAPTPGTSAADLRSADVGFLRELYESVVSREVRLALGEYYTPRGVAELAVEALDADDWATATFLDPGCGSGVFLAVCIDRKLAALRDSDAHSDSPAEIVERVTGSVLGIDLNPVAVTSAKLAYLLALAPVLGDADVDAVELPVFLTDALGLVRDDDLALGGESVDPTADYLVGNPPWIPWSRLADDLKARWRETYADDLELMPHDGAASRLGHANDDVSLPFVWVCVDRYLTAGGGASFVLKRDAMTGPAGKLLRTLRVGDRPLALDHVHDFGRLRPFGEQVGANAAIYALRADADPTFPADATVWSRSDDDPPDAARADFATADAMRATLARERTAVVPVDPDDRTSAWVRRDAEREALGECAHEIRHGVKDDAEDVFGIDRARLADIDSDLVYPYLKSRHVVKYGLFGHDLRLVPVRKANEDNEARLRSRYPETYEYLRSRRDALADRSSSWLENGPFYNVFGVGEYTWSEYKVVWCRLGFKPHFAVVSTVEDDDVGEKPVVPGDHCMFVTTDSQREAHFLCGLLNSAPYQRSLKTVASEGKASLSKAVVSKLRLPEYRATDRHRRLADLSMAAHEIVPEHTDTSKRAYNRETIPELEAVQAEIDRVAGDLLADEPTVFSRTEGT